MRDARWRRRMDGTARQHEQNNCTINVGEKLMQDGEDVNNDTFL